MIVIEHSSQTSETCYLPRAAVLLELGANDLALESLMVPVGRELLIRPCCWDRVICVTSTK